MCTVYAYLATTEKKSLGHKKWNLLESELKWADYIKIQYIVHVSTVFEIKMSFIPCNRIFIVLLLYFCSFFRVPSVTATNIQTYG